MLAVLEWVVWGIVVWFSVVFIRHLRRTARMGLPVHVALLLQLLLVLALTAASLVVPYSKLHLLWALPAALVLGWVLGFIVVPIPVVGALVRSLCLISAAFLLVGTEWRLGGTPWQIGTLAANALAQRRERARRQRTPQGFEAMICEFEDELFGIRLYADGIERFYAHRPSILERTEHHLRSIMDRGENALSSARELLAAVNDGSEPATVLRRFHFPPGWGPMSRRASAMVAAYEKVFPGRPREEQLTDEEHTRLMDEVLADSDFGPDPL
jgi:hypothetical protein